MDSSSSLLLWRLDMRDRLCPWLASPQDDDWTGCQNTDCGIWDDERECCSFNTKTKMINVYEHAVLSRFRDRLKVNIDLLLAEKTGWGRVELKERLFNLVDETKDESSL